MNMPGGGSPDQPAWDDASSGDSAEAAQRELFEFLATSDAAAPPLAADAAPQMDLVPPDFAPPDFAPPDVAQDSDGASVSPDRERGPDESDLARSQIYRRLVPSRREADAEACERAARSAAEAVDEATREEPASPRGDHELAAERGAPPAAGAADRAGARRADGSSAAAASGHVGIRCDHRPLIAPPHGARHDGAEPGAASDLAAGERSADPAAAAAAQAAAGCGGGSPSSSGPARSRRRSPTCSPSRRRRSTSTSPTLPDLHP